MKKCNTCKLIKLEKDFYKNKNSTDGYDSYCKECHKTRFRSYWLLKKYGITITEYDSLFSSQNNFCAICGSSQKPEQRTFAVDHNHKTKTIRGILCSNCNRLLGMVRENVNTLNKAISYLKERK
jgi:hypothetical protein